MSSHRAAFLSPKSIEHKICGNNKELLFTGREKAYGLQKKASSRIKKKIGSQALRKKKHVSCPLSGSSRM
jgi:hypothetical protein